MRETRNAYSNWLTLEEVYGAYFLVRRGAKRAGALFEFEYELLENIERLHMELRT